MRSAGRWWGTRTTAQRLDLPTRWSLILISASEPLVLLLIINARQQVQWSGALVLLAVSVVHAVVCVRLLRSGLEHLTGGPAPGRNLVVSTGAIAVLGAVVSLAAFPGELGPGTTGSAYPVIADVVVLFGAAVTAALTPMLRTAGLVVAVVLPAACVVAVQYVFAAEGNRLAWAVTYAFVVGGVTATYRFSVWSLGLIWEIDRSRETQARLAVAEERLRFARDLHDVLGRNLSLIAVKSELAAQLARRGEAKAVDHMLEIRTVAQDSMREVREVVGGYRGADLDTELAGARSVLASAGVATRVIGDGAGLPGPVQAALGWVVREATTNIIRHSDASTARIELDTEGTGRVVVLEVENDGARQPGADPGAAARVGSGLVGLRERLAGVGGRLDAVALPGGRFVVTATLPLGDGPPATSSPVAAGRLP